MKEKNIMKTKSTNTCNNNDQFDHDLPQIFVRNTTEHEDGTMTIEFDTNDAFDKMYLEQTGKKRITKRGLSNFIYDLIEKSITNTDGYSIENSSTLPD